METILYEQDVHIGPAGPYASQRPSLLADLSVIIPVGPSEISWLHLLSCLRSLPNEAEIIIVGTSKPPSYFTEIVGACGIGCPVRWVTAPVGRARQMNAGALNSSRTYLWFLHADSQFAPGALDSLANSIETYPEAIHYFRLQFQTDGLKRMALNTLGVDFRSRVLGLPFGDQGFCLSRDVFVRLGRFNETVAYGEDHLLIWAAHRRRVRVQEVNELIVTSSRTFLTRGWLRTTFNNLWRTWYQAFPQLIALIWSRLR